MAQERFHAVVAVVHRVEVVDEERVDHRDAHALDAVFIGTHHAVTGVIEADLDGQGSVGHRCREGGRIGGPVQCASDLGGEGVGVTGLGTQDGSEAKLALAPAVPRRGVVEGDARGPGGLQGGGRLRFRDEPAHVADGCRATAEGRQGEGGVSELLQAVRIHGALSIAPAPGGMRRPARRPRNIRARRRVGERRENSIRSAGNRARTDAVYPDLAESARDHERRPSSELCPRPASFPLTF